MEKLAFEGILTIMNRVINSNTLYLLSELSGVDREIIQAFLGYQLVKGSL